MIRKKFAGLLVLSVCFIAIVIGDDKDKQIIVVGAGIAGMAAANKLINTYGFKNVKVLEASPRTGGRIMPIRDPSFNGVLDMGADYIHGKVFNPVYEAAERLGALATAAQTSVKDNSITYWYSENGCRIDGTILDSIRQMLAFLDDQVLTQSATSGQTMSVRQMYDAAFQSYTTQFGSTWGAATNFYKAAYKFERKIVESDVGALDWDKVSARSWKAFDEPPEDAQIYMGVNGFEPILKDFENKVKMTNIQFNAEVTNIAYAPNTPVQVTVNGATRPADHVIFTPSLGYLKKHISTLFQPPLPSDKLSAIANIGFDEVDKVFLVYDKPFWPTDFGKQFLMRVDNPDPWNCIFSALPNETYLSQAFWYFETHPVIPNVLTAVIAGSFDPAKIESSTVKADHIKVAATVALRRFTNKNSIPYPTKVFWSKWSVDPFHFGSISYYTPTCDQQSTTCNAATLQRSITVSQNGKDTPVLLFAGEATHEALFDTIQGAWMTGEEAADNINNFYFPPATDPPLRNPPTSG